MSNVITMTLKGTFDRSMAYLKEFIDVCPEEVWIKKSGGWPIWQQALHAVAVVGFFANNMPEGGSEEDKKLAMLSICGEKPKTKAEILVFFKVMSKIGDDFFASMNDAKLTEECAHFKQQTGLSLPYGSLLSMMASHNFYHLGSMDAALRDAGLKGVF